MILIILLLIGSGALANERTPKRVVSINLCTDQLLLMLAEPAQIASVSYLARDPDSSFVAEQALAYPINHARLEELITLQPDLVLAGAYTDPRLLRQLKRFGMRVEKFPLTDSIEGIKADIRRMAELLGRPQQGRELIETMTSKIARVEKEQDHGLLPPKALFYQPRGYTSGKQTLQDAALQAAGWRNIAAELGIEGYASIDLETLLLAEPEQLFTSSHTSGAHSRAQQQLYHPALQRLLNDRPILEIPFKYWICAGPMIADAIAVLHDAHVE
ncbi:MAG: ABC transporter substrate-binding protein [Pseudomonadota bacterium]